jgi:hypothetical protein
LPWNVLGPRNAGRRGIDHRTQRLHHDRPVVVADHPVAPIRLAVRHGDPAATVDLDQKAGRAQLLEQLRTTGLLVEVDSRGRVTVPNGKPNWRYRVISYNDGTIVMEPLGPVINTPPTRVPGSEKEVTDVPDLEGRL